MSTRIDGIDHPTPAMIADAEALAAWDDDQMTDEMWDEADRAESLAFNSAAFSWQGWPDPQEDNPPF